MDIREEVVEECCIIFSESFRFLKEVTSNNELYSNLLFIDFFFINIAVWCIFKLSVIVGKVLPALKNSVLIK